MSNWKNIWGSIRYNLQDLSPCPDHPDYPHVRTLSQGVINDIVKVNSDGIVVRSHRTEEEDRLDESHFRVWWNHLYQGNPATTDTADVNCPEPYRSSITAAIFTEALSDRVEQVDQKTIRLRS